MSRFEHQWQKYFKSRISPEQYIEDYLINLDKLDEEETEFSREYQNYLIQEREKLLPEIFESFDTTIIPEHKGVYSRIVSSEHCNDPLCIYGSICEPGRFNFGALPSYYQSFGALYVASDEATAYLEKFHYLQGQKMGAGELSPENLSLEKPPSYLHVRIDLNLERCLDLRNDVTLEKFLDVVKRIKPTRDLELRWKQICKKRNRKKTHLKTVQTLDSLKAAVFSEKFKQWLTWLDCPSPSQWIGHYAYRNGVQGIIYPSVRRELGYNIALLPDNFEESSSYASLYDTVASVSDERKTINASTCRFFSMTLQKVLSQKIQ